jgi:hypothetical protein
MMRGNDSRSLKGTILLLTTAVALFCITCRDKKQEKPPPQDRTLNALRIFIRYPWLPADAKERAENALTKYQNKTPAPEPVLIVATLGKVTGDDQVYLNFLAYDEDRDLEGFVVEEEHQDPNGRRFKFEERYPAFTHLRMTTAADIIGFPINLRGVRERMDEERWVRYRDEPVPAGIHWEDTLPPVWISLPEPNRAAVSLFLYDSAGHKSNQVRLLSLLKEQRGNPRSQSPN